MGTEPRASKRPKKGDNHLGPKDPFFQTNILRECGLYERQTRSGKVNPADISKTGLPSSSALHIEKNDDELEVIALDFSEFTLRRYDEHTLSTICSYTVVPREPFIHTGSADDIPCVRTSVRRDRFNPQRKGPPISQSEHYYDWQDAPDITYAVSINMFETKYRTELEMKKWSYWLAEPSSVCPYLTIEYKCTDKCGKAGDAKNQVAAAALIWLYQRKKMRNALKLPFDSLKHYAVTIVDCNYNICVIRCEGQRFCMDHLAKGSLMEIDGLKRYITWSNAIHAWGLGRNASSFKKDMEALIDHQLSTGNFPIPPDMLLPEGSPPISPPSESDSEEAALGSSVTVQGPG